MDLDPMESDSMELDSMDENDELASDDPDNEKG